MTDQTPDLCPTCGIDLDYPTGPHILDCPAPTVAPPLNGMTDQTPSTEDVRYGYRTGVTAPLLPVEAGAAFDAWLAAHDREVAAKALRDAAAFWGENPDEVDDETPADCRNWLRCRADRIGAGDE